MAKGLYLVGREMVEHPVVGLKKPLWFAAWVWMLGEARWKDHKLEISGQSAVLRRGQLSCSYRFMSERLGMTVKGVRVFIARIERENMITIGKQESSKSPKKGTVKGTGQTIITICKYDEYQDFNKYRAQLETKEGHSRGTAGAQTRTPDETPDETPVIIEAAKAPPKNKRGTRISQDWVLPDEWKDWAITQGANATLEGEKFYDYWIAKPGQGGVKLDWAATWRNWIRNSTGRAPPKSGNGWTSLLADEYGKGN